MIDFANKFIGGGVMNQGMVQEEIYFVIYPECLISCFCCEKMQNWESIYITGAKWYSKYSGYAGKTKFAGRFDDPLDDTTGRINWTFAAIDAIHYAHWDKTSQFIYEQILWEVWKAYIGFQGPPDLDPHTPISTGRWGCGAFNGDTELKFLI